MITVTETTKPAVRTFTIYLGLEELNHLISLTGGSRATDLNGLVYNALFDAKHN